MISPPYRWPQIRPRSVIALFTLLALAFLAELPSASQLAIRTERVRSVAQSIWRSDFQEARDSGRAFVVAEPDNPIGYLLLGITHYSISNQFRSDGCTDTAYFYLDSCIALAKARIAREPSNPDWYFVLGSAHGYRGLNRGAHGSWWGAFKDANQASSNLKRCLELDSTYMDAWYGIGVGDYWKSAKARFLTWLPFISDKRDQGIREVLLAGRLGYLASQSALKSLLPIYTNQKNWNGVVILGDSLHQILPKEAGCLLYTTRALIELGQFPEATAKVKQLREIWTNSPFADACGAMEADYLAARIAFEQKDLLTARQLLGRILSADGSCGSNAYFKETLQSAKSLASKVH